MLADILIVIITMMLCGLFAGSEIAFFTANKFKIELLNSQGDRTGRILSRFLKNTPRFISTILVGNNLALVLYGISASNILTVVFENYWGWNRNQDAFLLLVIQTIISTLFLLFIGEYIPKIAFKRSPDKMLISFAHVLDFFWRILKPIVAFFEMTSKLLVRLIFKNSAKETRFEFSKYDLQLFIEENFVGGTEGIHNEIDADIFTNALDFNKIKVREFMVPRTEIVAIDVNQPIADLLKLFRETELSRIIVYENTLDNILGFAHSLTMFRKPEQIHDIIQKVLIVPESMPANVLLSEYSENQTTVAIAVDEFGGTAGLVTIEDLVEVVFGDIEDEHDNEEDSDLTKQKIGDNTYLFSGRLYIEEVNEEFKLNMPESEEYSTISGLIMHHAEHILKQGETLQVGNYKITVMRATSNKIEVVKLENLGVSAVENKK